MICVFLVDDHEVVRRGIRKLLDIEEDMEIIGEASNAAEALSRIFLDPPDVAILDVRLPDRDGIEVCREIRSNLPGVACLILTSFADDAALVAAVIAGASGFVLKQIRGTDLVGCVRRVARGESLLDASLVARAKAQLGRRQVDERFGRLTSQERRILDLVAEGKTNREIAGVLCLAESTVKNYISHVLMKLGLKRRTQAAVFAVRAEGTGRQRFDGPD